MKERKTTLPMIVRAEAFAFDADICCSIAIEAIRKGKRQEAIEWLTSVRKNADGIRKDIALRADYRNWELRERSKPEYLSFVAGIETL